MTTLTIERVGHTGRAFRIQHNRNVVEVRTRSPRRFLVVNLQNGGVVKRTDSYETAERESRKSVKYVVVDVVVGEFRVSRFRTATTL